MEAKKGQPRDKERGKIRQKQKQKESKENAENVGKEKRYKA